jgi:rfaE bifunctional protein nucleotidyltransferase chain/domain
MTKLLPLRAAPQIAEKLYAEKKRIVLAGGCFDILHPGHMHFLTRAREAGDVLVLLLESAERIRRDKGEMRPIHTQSDRAHMLEALSCVDYIIPLPRILSGPEYDKLVIQLKPAIIATTAGDPYLRQRKQQAKRVGGEVVRVTRKKQNHSTTRIADLLASEL